ncbi:MAG: phosphate transport regulator, partial [Gammaproteobacteria bacterium]
LNALQASLAGETIDGCHAYGIHDADRSLIAAFMAGVNRTAPLKFDHPGFSATATRVADKLVLQNDIGTTDAHVLVIHVTGRTVTVTYTDVHLPRLLFFQSLFEEYDVDWQDTRSRMDAGMQDGVYHLCVGNYTAPGNARLRAYLDHLGSRLVFLIDWNRARKRLRRFVPRKTAIKLLKWAAEENIGHMAWLKAGGEQLIFDAMSFAYGRQLKPGDRLDDLLTETRAVQFLRFNLKQALEGLRQGRPASLIGDEIRTELASQVRSTEDALLDTSLEHAGFIVLFVEDSQRPRPVAETRRKTP